MLRKSLYLSTFFFAAVVSCVAADNASVTGRVTDSSGAAVSGASIQLQQVAGSALLSARSGSDGHFGFNNVAPGAYLLEASAPGLSMAHAETLTLKPGEQKDVAIDLTASAVRSEVTVVAADRPQSVDEISKALDTVNAADAERRGIFSVSDAVRFVPGLRVSTRGGPGGFTTIQSRGLFVEGTAILIDGFPFRDPTSIQDEASAYLGDLLLVDTSRIEVLRGSGSSLYGTNAMGGALDIITDSGGGPMHGDLDLQGGGLGLFRGLAHVAGGALANRLTYSAGLSHLNVSDGVDDAGAVRDWSGQGAVDYALTPKIHASVDLFANTAYDQLTVSPSVNTVTIPPSGIIPAIPNGTFVSSLGDPDSGRYGHFVHSLFRFEHEINSRLSYQIGYAIADTDRLTTDGPAGPGLYQPLFNTSLQYDGRIDTVRAQVNYLLGQHQILTGGYEFEREGLLTVSNDQNPDVALRNYFRTKASQQTNALFVQDQIRLLGGRLAILLSGRFTRATLTEPTFSGTVSPYANSPLSTPPSAYTGDASIAYFLRGTSTKVRAHVGNSFRLPSLYERFGTELFDGFLSNYGDPRLSPERSIGFDFGFDQYLFHDHVKVSSTYFYTRLQEIIGFLEFPPEYIDPFGRTGGYYNTGGGISRGVELSGEFHPARRTSVFASYTYTNAKDRNPEYYTGTEVIPLQTARILPNTVTIVATEQLGKHVDLGLDFEGGSNYLYPLYGYAYEFDGPRQLGLDAGYSVRLGERVPARFYVRVSNALDQNFYEDGFRTPGRWAVGGMRFSF